MTSEEIEAIRELSAAINSLVAALPKSNQLGGGWPPITVYCQCSRQQSNVYPLSPYGPNMG